MMALTVAVFGFVTPVFAADDASKEIACKAINGSYANGICSTSAAGETVNSLIATIVNLFSWAVGLIAVLFIIYAGFRYVTSGGDAGKITSAKNTLVYAVVGLVIAAMAQILVQFVLSKTVTSSTPTTTTTSAPAASTPTTTTPAPTTTPAAADHSLGN